MGRDITEIIEQTIVGVPALRKLGGALHDLNVRLFLESPLRPLKTFLNGTWLGHPLHPLLTDIPVGAWTIAMVLDLVGFIFGLPGLGQASGIVTGIGTAGAVAAATAGVMDYTDTDPPEVTVAFTHGLINVLATLFFAASFIWRWRDNWNTRAEHFVISGIGYLLVALGAYIGGSLVFRQGVMVNRNAYRRGPKDYIPVMPLAELADQTPRRVELQGQPVLLYREGDRVYAIGAVCSHYGGPLEKGLIADGCVECPWHYSLYSFEDGSYKRGPTTAPVPAYETRVLNGLIELKLKQ